MTEPRPPTRDQSLNHPCRIRNVPLIMIRSNVASSKQRARISSSTVEVRTSLPCNLAMTITHYKTIQLILQVHWFFQSKNWFPYKLNSIKNFVLIPKSILVNIRINFKSDKIKIRILFLCEKNYHTNFFNFKKRIYQNWYTT